MKAFVGQALLWLSLFMLGGAAGSNELFFKSSLPPPEKLHKVLFLLPVILPSHVMSVAPLAAALAARGHEVHTLCDTSDVYKIPNVTCIHMDAHLPALDELSINKYIDDTVTHVTMMASALELIANLTFSTPAVSQLYEKRKEYDIIVIEQVAMLMLYPLVHETTFALFSTVNLNPCQSAEFGNVQNPAYVATGLSDYPRPYSYLDRAKSFVSTMAFCFGFRWITYKTEKRNREQFPGLPSLLEVERNASLQFLTTNPVLEGPLALLPTQVDIGGLILRPSQPLPQDIADFLEGDDPVIYFSLGVTFVHKDTVDRKKKEMIISVLRKFPYKILFKIKGQKKKKIGNMLFHYDVPQQDILGHRNVKLFISHWGLGGTQEALYHGVPIVGFPATWEHKKTAEALVTAGVGIQLSWTHFSQEEFENAIKEVMSNTSYRHKMAVMSLRFRDQLQTPLDRAVYWTEYIARHRGAPHLRSPAKELSWIQILGIDLIVGALLILYIAYFLFKRLCIIFLSRVAFSAEKKKLL